MTDDVESADPADLDEARIQRIAERFVQGSDEIANLPKDATITRDILWLYLAHADENWDTNPPEHEIRKLMVRSFFLLERRVMNIEAALRKAGLMRAED